MDQEEIRQRKLNELREKYSIQAEQQQKQIELENQVDLALKTVLSDEAKTRLFNVKLVNKELYFKTAQNLIYLAKSGKIQVKLNDMEVKRLLEQLSAKREITIKRK